MAEFSPVQTVDDFRTLDDGEVLTTTASRPLQRFEIATACRIPSTTTSIGFTTKTIVARRSKPIVRSPGRISFRGGRAPAWSGSGACTFLA